MTDIDSRDPLADDAGTDSVAEQPADVVPAVEQFVAEAAAANVAPAPETTVTKAPLPPVSEAERKRGRRIWTGVIIGCLVVGAIGAFFGWQFVSGRVESAGKLDDATVIIKKADETVLAVDEVVRAEITPEVGEKAAVLKAALPTEQQRLEDAIALIDEARPSLNSDEQERADALKAAAQARLKMLTAAAVVLQANAASAEALTPAKQSWQLVLDAEKLTDKAVQSYNKLTKAGVTQSSGLNAQATADLNKSKQLLATVEKVLPSADTELYVAYVDGKLGLVAISRQSDKAWLANDIVGANKYAEQYNATEKKVLALAKKLPASPGKMVADGYEELAGAATDEYYKAREEATKADDELRGL